jgi:hypothetical protein
VGIVKNKMKTIKTRLIIITKNQYGGHQRKIGFFEFSNTGANEYSLYYNFGNLNGAHTSYHKDGNIYRTSPATGINPSTGTKKAKFITNKIPLESFNGLFQLEIFSFSKNTIIDLPKIRQKYYKSKECETNKIYEIDIESFPSSTINIISELIEPGFEFNLPKHEICAPKNAVSKLFTELSPWINLTILGHPDNLLITLGEEEGYTENNFNKRFSATRYSENFNCYTEIYSDQALKIINKK